MWQGHLFFMSYKSSLWANKALDTQPKGSGEMVTGNMRWHEMHKARNEENTGNIAQKYEEMKFLA